MLQQIGKKVLLLDGGMGSEIEKKGLSHLIPEELNISHKEEIIAIHKSYEEAGSDFITTNTFGLNRIKYKGKYSLKELVISACENARATNKKILFDIGPIGQMLKPIGNIEFDEAYETFKEVVLLAKDLVDGFICETFSDLYELKACILAIKENSSLPVIATMTFDESYRTLTGSTPEIVVNTLEGLGVDALGVNCSLGPKELYPIVERFCACSHTSVVVQPNRGLPNIFNGKTFYNLPLEEFVDYTSRFLELGVSIIGVCCGTNPDFIKAISIFKGKKVKNNDVPYKTIINSNSMLTILDKVVVCGERLNPTGKKKLKEAILNEDYNYLIQEAYKQSELGVEVLDLNVGLPKIDEVNVMVNAVKNIQQFINVPLQIDSSNKDAIEKGVRYYNGIPLINSVNGEDEVMDKVFPIAKKYGAVVLGLTLDNNGVPSTAEKRFEIAKRIIKKAEEYGIPKHRVMIDTLVLTASAEQDLVKETLKALSLVKELGVKTALGVSNVSFGLPNRPLLNRTFLTMALYNGLTMPIMNPFDKEMMGAINAFNVLIGNDKESKEYINLYQDINPLISSNTIPSELTLFEAVKKGLKNEVICLTNIELEKNDPMYVINEILIKSLSEVGELYDKGKIFLPQLISSAEAAKEAFGVITNKFPKSSSSKAQIIMATVKGDVHDIGKNICKVVLESYGYEVIDLGRDTPIDNVVKAYIKYKPFAIGLSALMTTTVLNMEATIKALREVGCTSYIFVGGAVLSEEIAKEINADFYTKDALGLVNKLEELLNK